jgi:hypothetical protein
MSLTIENVAPINLSVKLLAVGLRVFYGTTEVDDLLDDVFPESTPLTNVAIYVYNDTDLTIYVSFNNGAPVEVSKGSSTSRTLTMPDAGACNSMNVTVSATGIAPHDPVIRLKRKLGNVTPTCTSG